MKRNPYYYILGWFLFIGILAAFLTSCSFLKSLKNQEPSTKVQGMEIAAPDSLPDPIGANGWVFVRTSATHGVFLPPVVPKKVKQKNVGNDYSKVKDTGNTTDKSVVKDKSKAKPKVKAKEGAAIGEGNTVKQEKGIPPLLIYIVLFFVALFLLWPQVKKYLPF